MNKTKDICWFKEVVNPKLKEYEVEYRFFEEGDFGSLNQVSIDSEEIAGEIDFWELGWLGIHLWDCVKNDWLLNVLLEAEQRIEQEKAIEQMLRLLKL